MRTVHDIASMSAVDRDKALMNSPRPYAHFSCTNRALWTIVRRHYTEHFSQWSADPLQWRAPGSFWQAKSSV
jgi:hypothetical protein